MSFVLGTVLGIVRGDEILLIRRNNYPFVGFWGLPGGKVRPGESMEDTALREAAEETGMGMEFHSFRGTVDARIVEDGEVRNRFVLLVCRLTPGSGEPRAGEEGELRWFRLGELERIRDSMIPDDVHMIEKMILGREGGSFISVMEKNGDDYVLKRFERNEYGN
jgi:8-oxo-dGTP diphosphatase